jgi:hypothetical protein
MKHKLPALLALLMLAIPGTASALETDSLIALTAMPLVVADVVALPEVPQTEVMTLVTTLNRAAVPAPQFIEVVRYAPVALVQPAEPRFVSYVTQEYDRGITGEPLALAIADRYDAYGIDDVDIADPPVITVVEQRQVLPQMVVTRFQPVQFDPLALVAMPLAVAAVSNLVNVPQNDLMQFVASLNQALVPAPQFVEVVRYAPMVLVDRTESPQFIQFVNTEVNRGLIGRPLAFAIADRIDMYEPVEINLIEPRPRLIVDRYVDRDDILPPVVVRRVARADTFVRTAQTSVQTSAHPHGGPPGQLKKELGLQTGAEVVHGTRPARVATARSRTAVRSDDSDRRARVTKERRERQRAVRHAEARQAQPRVKQSKPRVKQAKPRVEPAKRIVRSEPRVRQERATAAAPQQRIQAAPRGNSGHGGGQARGSSGGGKGKGKGKGKG